MEESINKFELNQIEDKNSLEEKLKLKEENNNFQLSDFNFPNGDNIYLENFLSKEFEELNKENNLKEKFEETNIENNYEIHKLPCKCNLCSKTCYNNYFNFLLVKFTLRNYNIAYEVVEFSRYKLCHILHYYHLGNPSFDIRNYHLCHR